MAMHGGVPGELFSLARVPSQHGLYFMAARKSCFRPFPLPCMCSCINDVLGTHLVLHLRFALVLIWGIRSSNDWISHSALSHHRYTPSPFQPDKHSIIENIDTL
jgi:hypothetical protein